MATNSTVAEAVAISAVAEAISAVAVAEAEAIVDMQLKAATVLAGLLELAEVPSTPPSTRPVADTSN